jgi:hypothetical protein
MKNFFEEKITFAIFLLILSFGFSWWLLAFPSTTIIGEDVTVGNNLYVPGRVGIGTMQPEAQLHIISSDTSTVPFQVEVSALIGNFRKPITIDNTSNANTLTDYQVLVTLDTASLISAGKMRSDCGDIRFTDSDGQTLLNYWLESGCNTASTKIWVKVPLIPASATKTIYVYYGNPSATSQSNGIATFDWFDDFDPDKVSWTVLAGTWSNTAGYQGNSKKGVNDGAYVRETLADGSLSLADFVLEANVRSTVDGSLANIVFRAATNGRDDNDRIWVRLDQRPVSASHYGGFHLFEDVGGTEYVRAYYDFDPVVSQWYKIKVQVHGNSAEGFLDGVQRWSTTALSRTAAGYIQLQVEDNSGDDAWFDNVFIRKYTSPEPTTSVGAEEPAPLSEQIGLYIQPQTGNVSIGTTTADYKLRVEGTAAAYNWVTLSDISLKENIQSLNFGALNKVLKLRPVSFYWKDKNIDKEKHFGFVAQEVEKVLPELVREDSEGKKHLNYDEFIPLLVAAIKEQQRQIEQLKLEINEKGSLSQNGKEIVNPEFSTSSIELIKQIFKEGILQIEKLFVKEIVIEKSKIKEAEIQKARINKIEMVDQNDGQIYCIWVENGEIKKVKGECDTKKY